MTDDRPIYPRTELFYRAMVICRGREPGTPVCAEACRSCLEEAQRELDADCINQANR